MEAEVAGDGSVRRRLWTAEEKRRIVEQTMSSALSVAMVARKHGVNANQVFYWRIASSAGFLPIKSYPLYHLEPANAWRVVVFISASS